MRFADFLAHQLIYQMTDVEFLLCQQFLSSFVLAVQFDCYAVVNVEQFRVIVELAAGLGDKVEEAKCLFEIVETILCSGSAFCLVDEVVFGELVEAS